MGLETFILHVYNLQWVSRPQKHCLGSDADLSVAEGAEVRVRKARLGMRVEGSHC